MASTTLFAPQVRAVQPAFIYNGAIGKSLPQSDQIILKIDIKTDGTLFYIGPLSGQVTAADWGDGSAEAANGHTYAKLGVYICKLTLYGNTLPSGAFQNKTEIIEIIIGDGITTIGDNALDCPNVNKIYSSNKTFPFNQDHFDGKNMKEIVYIDNSIARIYFNLSSYNTINDVKYILYTIIDPNKASTWGTNSVTEAAAAPAEYLYVSFPIRETKTTPVANRLYYTLEDGEYIYKGKLSSFETRKRYYYFNQDPDTGEFYIEINLSDGTQFKEITKNQFYQVQLYFCDRDPSFKKPREYQADKSYYQFNSTSKTYSSVSSGVTEDNFSEYWITDRVINLNTLEDNKDNISAASQATLIRPISALEDGFPVFELPSTGGVYDLPLLRGRIEYLDGSIIEIIDTCWIEIYKNSDNTKVYTSPQKIKNQLGLSFEIPIQYNNFEENQSYKLKIFYTTKHGFNDDCERDITITKCTEDSTIPVETVVINNPKGILLKSTGAFPNGSNKIQIKNNDNNNWETVEVFNSLSGANIDLFNYYNIENNTPLQLRVLCPSIGNKIKTFEFTEDTLYFDDIFLSDADTMLAVRYNPNISGLKYVTQEAITNTLGGKYPVIRKNGDTRYRQFNLSGTLCMNASKFYSSGAGTSVVGQDYSSFFDHLGEQPSLYVKNMARLKGYTTKDRLERQARELAIDFLTNNSIKLFRSPTEGNMIVYLSGVSFTPNKQLGRNVYDFSCTVTEVCEYNMENIKKYNLNDGREFKEAIKTAYISDGDSVTSWPEEDEL